MPSSSPSPSTPRTDPKGSRPSRPATGDLGAAHKGFTCTGNLFLILGSVALGLFASLLGWLPPRGAWMMWFARAWGRGMLLASGSRLEVVTEAHSPRRSVDRGSGDREELDPGASFIYMANHQSLYDVAALLAALPGNPVFLAKRSLFRIPFFGWSLTAGGFVPVDRDDRSTARDTFQLSLERLRAGRSLVIFPEETRSADGQLLPFKPGGFLLALKSGSSIVPVGIDGTLQIRPKGKLGIRPHRVRVVLGRPVDPAAFGVARRRELIETVRERIEALRNHDDETKDDEPG